MITVIGKNTRQIVRVVAELQRLRLSHVRIHEDLDLRYVPDFVTHLFVEVGAQSPSEFGYSESDLRALGKSCVLTIFTNKPEPWVIFGLIPCLDSYNDGRFRNTLRDILARKVRCNPIAFTDARVVSRYWRVLRATKIRLTLFEGAHSACGEGYADEYSLICFAARLELQSHVDAAECSVKATQYFEP